MTLDYFKLMVDCQAHSAVIKCLQECSCNSAMLSNELLEFAQTLTQNFNEILLFMNDIKHQSWRKLCEKVLMIIFQTIKANMII